MTDNQAIQCWIILCLFGSFVITFPWSFEILRYGSKHVWKWLFSPVELVDDSLLTDKQRGDILRLRRQSKIYFFLAILIWAIFLGEYVWDFWKEYLF